MKKGKYVGAKFTDDQRSARHYWRLAQERETKLCDALRKCDPMTRKEAHERLDMQYDHIERIRDKARALFPDVGISFTIASEVIKL